jgi:2-keto-4-pentenoate hydratase/2-oxohepta-3-ene-1,7-dioic acid hydratase in catechol pathway
MTRSRRDSHRDSLLQEPRLEIELTAVIGKPGRNIRVEDALQHVAGYTIANDISARDLGRRPEAAAGSPFSFDWTGQKCFDGACPIGPWIVPADDIPDPQNLSLKLWVNDVIKQDSNTSEMIFTLAEQIAQLSIGMTLYPGDLILTGTPAGVGQGRGRVPQGRRCGETGDCAYRDAQQPHRRNQPALRSASIARREPLIGGGNAQHRGAALGMLHLLRRQTNFFSMFAITLRARRDFCSFTPHAPVSPPGARLPPTFGRHTWHCLLCAELADHMQPFLDSKRVLKFPTEESVMWLESSRP